ncbi:hypothetical protein EDB19DRAFT_1781460, partial [Suillus lakei]
MRFSSVLAVVAALIVSISAMPSVVDASISAREVDTEQAKFCPMFCVIKSDCKGCGSCVNRLFLHRLVWPQRADS